MPHADAAHFSEQGTKSSHYAQLLASLQSLTADQRNWVCNTANTASLLWHLYHSLPAPSNAVNWSGFYVLNRRRQQQQQTKTTAPSITSSSSSSLKTTAATQTQHETKAELILGPFMGKVACQTIQFGRGVCGEAAATKKTVIVKDVHEFPGHIACDSESRSEIVVPILDDNGRVVGVIDVDCAQVGGFDEVDQRGLEAIAAHLAGACDW